jgi:hypothetical protein
VLVVKIMRAEHSHNRAALTCDLEHVRVRIGMCVDRIYRVACESPVSKFSHINDAQAELAAEARLCRWPQSEAGKS